MSAARTPRPATGPPVTDPRSGRATFLDEYLPSGVSAVVLGLAGALLVAGIVHTERKARRSESAARPRRMVR